MQLATIVICTAFLSGCAALDRADNKRHLEEERSKARGMDSESILKTYGRCRYSDSPPGTAAIYEHEIVSRGLLSEAELETVRRGTVGVGDNVKVVFAVFGSPDSTSRTANADGEFTIYAFSSVLRGRHYIQTRGGFVTGFQESQ